MTLTVANLLEEAMLLSDDSRLELAERLVASAHTPADLLREQVQIASARMQALDAGQSVEVPGAEAHERVKQALRERP